MILDQVPLVAGVTWTGPMFSISTKWMTEQIKAHLVDAVMSYIAISPIVICVGFGVYVLLSLFSKTLAKFGVISVVLYSGAVLFFF